jgi:hypothetical protein
VINMPGRMIAIECPCGLGGIYSIGVSGLFEPNAKHYVVAFDPVQNNLCSIDEKEALQRGLVICVDSYPESSVMNCPRCGTLTCKVEICGNWD